jgi:hypothetical protein
MGGFCPVPMQSVPITTNIVSSNPTQYNIMQGFQSVKNIPQANRTCGFDHR